MTTGPFHDTSDDGVAGVPVEPTPPNALGGAALSVLHRCDLCRGLSRADLDAVTAACRVIELRSGQVVYRANEPGDSMFVVIAGRVRVVVEHGGGGYQLIDHVGKGQHFGEMAMLTDGPRKQTATAVMDTSLLEIGKDRFDQLMATVPGFSANLSRGLGLRLRWETAGRRRRRHAPLIVGLVNSTARTQQLAHLLATALVEHGERVEVLTDRDQTWSTAGRYLVERIPQDEDHRRRAALLHARLVQVIEHHERVLVDLACRDPHRGLVSLVEQCEEVWWLVEPDFAESSWHKLRSTLAAAPHLSERLHVVTTLPDAERFAPLVPANLKVEQPDFKVVLSADVTRPSRDQRHSMLRLARYLRGTRIGLALSGGGARGLAHLGVLRELEREGFFFDLVAGTSSGALMGLSYAGGWEPQDALERFKEQLTPNWLLRTMPGGRHTYMWLMFRTGAWDRMLRPHLGYARLEQLRTPLTTVAVDLVSGMQVARDTGDAIHAVMESVNLPVVARPILRDGMALVDGGVLNNLPADQLLKHGADFVVGVNVVEKLPRQFAGNRPETPTAKMRRPGPIDVMLRVSEVQDHGLSAIGRSAVDLMIAPDTRPFEFADFSKAFELADAGEAAAREAVPQLRQMLADLHGRQPPAG